MTSHHRDQLASTILRAVQEIGSRGLSDPRLDGTLLTFTELDLSPDGRNATVRVSVLPEKAQNRAIAALRHASRHLKHQLGDKLNLRTTPELTFTLDTSLKKQAQIYGALGKVADERRAAGADADEPQTPKEPDA